MGNRLVLKKHFFSCLQENKWLNQLGQKGYLLNGWKDGRFSFTVEEGKTYYYRVEWLDCSPEYEEILPELRKLEKKGVHLCASRSLWAYFVSEEPIRVRKEAVKRNVRHYRNPGIFFAVLTAVCGVLTYYHIDQLPFAKEQGLLLTVPSFTGDSNAILNLLKKMVYGLWLVVYNYMKLFEPLFGNTIGAGVLAFLIPIMLVFLILTVVWLSTSAQCGKEAALATEEPDDEPEENTEAESDEPEEIEITEENGEAAEDPQQTEEEENTDAEHEV